MNQDRDKLKLSAILNADVVGYSRLMEVDRAWTIKNLEENKNLISNLVEEYKGRVVDAPGDNILAEFSSITNAVECAVKIQKELKKKNSKMMEEHRMEFRIGINLGEVFEEDGRIYGSGVNIAARIEGLSKPGGICISGRTYDHVKTEFDFGYEYLGEHSVKNISEPIRVYRVLMEDKYVGKIIGEKKALVDGLEKASIAVLPFINLSSDPEQEYFVDGLSEEILNSLAQISNLSVIARTSSFSFKGTNKTIQEIANVLQVNNILEGSVRKAGNALRITAQLIRTSNGSHLWSETYNRELKDIFAVQEDIANMVADELKIKLKIGKPFKQIGSTGNTAAYEHFLIAKGLMSDIYGGQTEGDAALKTRRAEESLNIAISLDSEFALAWTFKVCIHWYHLTFTPGYHFDSEQDPGLNAALQAIQLEPNLAEAYYSLGLSRLLRNEFIEAELAYRKAIKLSYDPINCYQFGLPIHYLCLGHCEKANKIVEASRLIDPLNQTIDGISVTISSMLGDIKTVEEKYERSKAIFGDQWLLGNQTVTMTRLGTKDSISSDEVVPHISPIFDAVSVYLDSPEEGLAELHRIYKNDENLLGPYLLHISHLAAYFDDPEFAMDVTKKGLSAIPHALYSIWFPSFKKVRKLPQFKKFVRKKGLVDCWKQFGWPDSNICRPIGDDDFECN